MPVEGNLYLSDSLKCKSWKKEDEGTEAQPRSGGFDFPLPAASILMGSQECCGLRNVFVSLHQVCAAKS